jgi:hypothetical protein
MTDLQRAKRAILLTRRCLEVCDGDIEAALSAASILTQLTPVVSDWAQALLDTLDAGINRFHTSNDIALSLLSSQGEPEV